MWSSHSLEYVWDVGYRNLHGWIEIMFDLVLMWEGSRIVCVCVCVRACVRACVCVALHACMCMRVYRHAHLSVLKSIRTCIHTHTPLCVCVCVCVCVCALGCMWFMMCSCKSRTPRVVDSYSFINFCELTCILSKTITIFCWIVVTASKAQLDEVFQLCVIATAMPVTAKHTK